jgi:phosphatidylserine decarboxylase
MPTKRGAKKSRVKEFESKERAQKRKVINKVKTDNSCRHIRSKYSICALQSKDSPSRLRYNREVLMIRDGFYYALALIVAAVLIGIWAAPLLSLIPLLLAAFFLWFFRDPERAIPATPGAVVSPADGKVTGVSTVQTADGPRIGISIFLNVFDVHVNRSPAAGRIAALEYRRGKYLNAMNPASAELNEQSICTLETDDGQQIVFKQIAGLLARRIVFSRRVGDRVARGERIGLIKFGSRCDVILPPSASVLVQVGDTVKCGSSTLAVLPAGANPRQEQGER